MTKKNPYPKAAYEHTIWEVAHAVGEKTIKHSDREIQEQWMSLVLNGDMDYDEFMAWREGYLTAKTERGLP